MRRGTIDPLQEELPLSCLHSSKLFPGRTTLYLREVAKALSMTLQQVVDLIEGQQLAAIDISSGAFHPVENPMGNKTDRRFYRVPVAAFDEFVAKRSTLADATK